MPHIDTFARFYHRSTGSHDLRAHLQLRSTTPAALDEAEAIASNSGMSTDDSIGITLGIVAGALVLVYACCFLWQRYTRRRASRYHQFSTIDSPALKSTIEPPGFHEKRPVFTAPSKPTPSIRRPLSVLPWKVHSPSPQRANNRISFVGRATNRLSAMFSPARRSRLWAPDPARTAHSGVSPLHRPGAHYAHPPICPKTAACWKVADAVVGPHPGAVALEARRREGGLECKMFRWVADPFTGQVIPRLRTDMDAALDRVVVASPQEDPYPALARSLSGPKIMVTQPSSEAVVASQGKQQGAADRPALARAQTAPLQSNERHPTYVKPPAAQVLQSRPNNRQAVSHPLSKGNGLLNERRMHVGPTHKENAGPGRAPIRAQAF